MSWDQPSTDHAPFEPIARCAGGPHLLLLLLSSLLSLCARAKVIFLLPAVLDACRWFFPTCFPSVRCKCYFLRFQVSKSKRRASQPLLFPAVRQGDCVGVGIVQGTTINDQRNAAQLLID